MASSGLKDKAAIVGIGQTPFAKKGGRSELDAGCEAIRMALDDAGLEVSDVDGMVRYDLETNSPSNYARTLGIENLSFFGAVDYGGGAGCGTILHAVTAIVAGVADVVVCLRSRNRGSGGRPWAKTGNYVTGDWQFTSPYGLIRPVDQVAMIARRYMLDFGVKEEHFGAAAVACRKHAQRNPGALMRAPMSVEDHRSSRLVADPLRLFDCCLESDGSLACVITSAERARDLRQKPAYIHSAAQGMGPNHSPMTNYYKENFLQTASVYAARDLWKRSDIQPNDISCAQLYDAFSPLILISLEEYGFVKPGEAGDFVRAGNLEWPNGALPVNTSGGSLSEAYVHGFNLIVEAVRQIRGASTSQVEDCESVLVTSGAAVPNGALILRK